MIDILLPATAAGFVVGFRHAFEPDHLAAVTTLATREAGWWRGMRLGVVWGGGHTVSIALVAVVLVVLGIGIPERFFAAAELGVAALLVALGVWTLWHERRRPEAAPDTAPDAAPTRVRTASGALSFGVVHGLAGSGAVIVLLVAASNDRAVQVGYLAAFGIGTVLGMSLASLLAGAATDFAAARNRTAAQAIRVGAALLSIVAGLLLGSSLL